MSNNNISSQYQYVGEIFTKAYRIPKYQRPYSWEDDQCNQLWDDLWEHFGEGNVGDENWEEYFLGTTFIVDGVKEGKVEMRDVIDGQQRLITLSILLKRLQKWLTGDERYAAMVKKVADFFLCKKDEFSDSEETMPRIVSQVLGGKERKYLEKVLSDSPEPDTESDEYGYRSSRYYLNYQIFGEAIKVIADEGGNGTRKLREFTEYVIKKVGLLFLKPLVPEDALTIFKTVNGRGLDLTDASNLKVILYDDAKSEEGEFSAKWDDLQKDANVGAVREFLVNRNNPDPLTELFRLYMHVLRGREGITDDESGLLKFFTRGTVLEGKEKKDYAEKFKLAYSVPETGEVLRGWDEATNELERLLDAAEIAAEVAVKPDKKTPASVCYPRIQNWIDVLRKAGESKVITPALIRISRSIEYDGEDVKIKDEDGCVAFLKNLARWVYAKKLAYFVETDGTPNLKTGLYSAVVAAAKSERYEPEIWFNGGTEEKKSEEDFEKELQKPIDNQKMRAGLCMILELLEQEKQGCEPVALQYKEKGKVRILGDVEHILPQNFGKNYGEWAKEKKGAVAGRDKMHTIGNLVWLETGVNISIGDTFYEQKRGDVPQLTKDRKAKAQQWSYKNSAFLCVKKLRNDHTEWELANYEKRQAECVARLEEFFAVTYRPSEE